jgi:hypothetical protein
MNITGIVVGTKVAITQIGYSVEDAYRITGPQAEEVPGGSDISLMMTIAKRPALK